MMRFAFLAALLPAVMAQVDSNPTTLLTETDSLGRVTGMPTIPPLPSLPPLPTLASIPAGFSEGVTTVWVAPSTYAVISVHHGTTEVISSIVTKNLPGVPTPKVTMPQGPSVSVPTSVSTFKTTLATTSVRTKKGGMTMSSMPTSMGGKGGKKAKSTSSSSGLAVAGAAAAPGAVVAAAGFVLAWL